MRQTEAASPLGWLAAALTRAGAALRNGLEIAWLGGLGVDEASPFEVVARDRIFALRRYFADRGGSRPAILLVPPLMLTAEVYDVSAESSAVKSLAELGVDPWVVDFGAPEHVEGGLQRTLADHVLAVSEAVDRARDVIGRDVHLAGYSQGGMFCYQAAAYRRSAGLASVVTFGSPVDVHGGLPPGIPEEIAVRLFSGLGTLLAPVFSRAFIPAWAARTGFRMLDPVKDFEQRLQFLAGLYDRERLRRREGQRRFLASEGWAAYPGPALADFIEQFFIHNRLLSGGIVVDGRTVTLADVTCPILAFVGSIDEIARPRAVRAIVRAAPRAEIYEAELRAGHFGLVVGSKSTEITWPTVAEWLRWREGRGAKPALAREVRDEKKKKTKESPAPESSTLSAVKDDATLLSDIGLTTARLVGRAVAVQARSLRRLAENVLPQLPRLARLGSVRRDTPISLGLLLAERAASDPTGTFFLFEGRAYAYADANRRVDAVVRGFVSAGVRQGHHVGVLMRTRPSALAVIAALSRLGAVAVLLRPDGDLARELDLGEVEHVIADPESAARAQRAFVKPVLVLGGGGPDRPVPEGVVDLERVDPDAVELPRWFEPNASRAEDVALVLFAGRGERTRPNRVTNRRFALSAFGAASATALGASDTVYCVTPIHHPTGILVCVGGALAGGARLAVATEFAPATFWDEVRRYGASVVFYTGAMLGELVYAPRDAAERHHPLRLFAGSGMPRPIWQRVLDRFGPLDVVEFWASTEGNAILANLEGTKVGSVGRPLPGSAEVAVVEMDPMSGRVALGPDGFARRASDGEIGHLLVRVDRERGALEGRPLRGVFEAGDAWTSAGELFRRDGDGDHWRLDSLADVIDAAEGKLPTIPIEDALGAIDVVELAVVYGCRLAGGEKEVPIAALRLRRSAELDPDEITRAVTPLDPASRPRFVRIVDRIPMTAGFRPVKEPLRGEGVPRDRHGGRTIELNLSSGRYRRVEGESS